MPSLPTRRSTRPLLVGMAGALLVNAALLVPFPGSLSVTVTHRIASATAGLPGIALVSEVGLGMLAAATAAVVVHAWRVDRPRRITVGAAAVGVVLAYVFSEGAKLLLAQPRPCQRWSLPGHCPPSADWSLPSNHATLAFGAVVVIVAAVPRAWIPWAALASAALVATGRVLQGVHYVHDVALGAVVGLIVPATVLLIARSTRSRGPGSPLSRPGDPDGCLSP